MANFPCFTFPSAKESGVFDTTQPAKKGRPPVQLDTNADVREGYRLAIPAKAHSRPTFLRTLTPPDSPTRTRAATMGSQQPPKMHESGAITPPATPTTSATHARSNSASSDFLTSLSSLRRGDSPASSTGRPSLNESSRPTRTELRTFPYHLTDFEIQTDGEGRKRPIGSGAWSNVYLAHPTLPNPSDQPTAAPVGLLMSPPITPAHSRVSSTVNADLPSIPPLYAIKVPASNSAKKVLNAEARVLSYLSRFPGADVHIVPFYGQDTRTGALVLKAMDGTLDAWIETHLNTLDEASRASKLADIFPSIALSLIDSLIWMHDRDCIHADIKPSNILTSGSNLNPDLVFSDFSSTIITSLPNDGTPSQMGAGTWEFLDPSLLSSLSPGKTCTATDLWSLGITLLYLVLGTSPYEAFKYNKFQQREMIKSGSPLQCLTYGDQGIVHMGKLKTLSKDLGFDLTKWFAKVLVKNIDKRVDAAAWREELVSAMASPTARI